MHPQNAGKTPTRRPSGFSPVSPSRRGITSPIGGRSRPALWSIKCKSCGNVGALSNAALENLPLSPVRLDVGESVSPAPRRVSAL